MTSIEVLESFRIGDYFANKKKAKNANNSVAQQPRPKPGPSKDVVIRDMKKLYGIDIEEYPEDKFANKAALINSIRQDVTNWVSKIKTQVRAERYYLMHVMKLRKRSMIHHMIYQTKCRILL